jgi:hypothetical protein
MIDVSVRGRGVLFKHIRIIKEDDKNVYHYEYYRPGEGKLILGLVECDLSTEGVLSLMIKVLINIKEKGVELVLPDEG